MEGSEGSWSERITIGKELQEFCVLYADYGESVEREKMINYEKLQLNLTTLYHVTNEGGIMLVFYTFIYLRKRDVMT